MTEPWPAAPTDGVLYRKPSALSGTDYWIAVCGVGGAGSSKPPARGSKPWRG